MTRFTAVTITNEHGDMCEHKIQGMTLHIEKDDKSIILDQDEIMTMLERMGIASSDFKAGFWWKDGRQG
jgi:hypothetical protein